MTRRRATVFGIGRIENRPAGLRMTRNDENPSRTRHSAI
jgi:hypothetical protein